MRNTLITIEDSAQLMLGVGLDRVRVVAEVMRDLFEHPDTTADVYCLLRSVAGETLAHHSVTQAVEWHLAKRAPMDGEIPPTFNMWARSIEDEDYYGYNAAVACVFDKVAGEMRRFAHVRDASAIIARNLRANSDAWDDPREARRKEGARTALGWVVFMTPDEADRDVFVNLLETQAHKMNGGGVYPRLREWDAYGEQTVEDVIALFEGVADSLTLEESPVRQVAA